MTYLILFFSAFVSATLFPLGSEALLIYDIKEGYNIYLLVLVATLGNTLGSVFNSNSSFHRSYIFLTTIFI